MHTKKRLWLLSVTLLIFASPAMAQITPAGQAGAADADAAESSRPASAPANKESFSTGVAKARDQLDSATSTSMLDSETVINFGLRDVPNMLRLIPGVRTEASSGEGYANVTIRGLPLSANGAKYVQFQEDGLPVFEFGDIGWASSDEFLRSDLNLAGVQAIRGGSASTFASNSPGGVINLISKTGVAEGGAIATTIGLDFERYRLDFDYGGKLSDSLRMHIGGFYREGEGPRAIGLEGERGGQVKLNITKEFNGGYIRFYGKYLDDRTPAYSVAPVAITGSNANPKYRAIAGFDPTHDTLMSKYMTNLLTLDSNNQLASYDLTDGQHPVVKSVGFETQFDLAGWTITNRTRYSDISGGFRSAEQVVINTATAVATQYGGAGATLSYANGPNAGQVITNPSTLNGNGLLVPINFGNLDFRSLDNFTNDARASRTFALGTAELTLTGGFYKSRQEIDVDYLFGSVLSEVKSDGEAALINLTRANGTAVTQNGYYSYGPGFGSVRLGHLSMRTTYDVAAPYGSANIKLGKLSLGGSLRYDFFDAEGSYRRATGYSSLDVNNDGTVSAAETRVSQFDLTTSSPLDYSTEYLSYSMSANYRVSQNLSGFLRYSRGGRANAERLVRNSFVDLTTGELTDSSAAVDIVKQLEGGVKYRNNGVTLQITGFSAKADDTNGFRGSPFTRTYDTKGFEFEGEFQRGPFRLNTGATYTDAEISADNLTPSNIGHRPGRQPDWIFQATPQIATKNFSVGAAFIGTTSSYTDPSNQLRQPGYITTDAFARYNLTDSITVSVNANNLFDVLAVTDVNDTTIPASGVGLARVLNPRAISATLSYSF
jgi:outer membrane receptor protein involved in Fe transport